MGKMKGTNKTPPSSEHQDHHTSSTWFLFIFTFPGVSTKALIYRMDNFLQSNNSGLYYIVMLKGSSLLVGMAISLVHLDDCTAQLQ